MLSSLYRYYDVHVYAIRIYSFHISCDAYIYIYIYIHQTLFIRAVLPESSHNTFCKAMVTRGHV
jgi:hypothetical protein